MPTSESRLVLTCAFAEAVHEPGREPALRPALEGRPLTLEEFAAFVPERMELREGRIPGAEDMLLLLLSQVGLRRAVELVGHRHWLAALLGLDLK